MDKTSSRQYGLIVNSGTVVTPQDLDLIRSNALRILLDEPATTPAYAWTKAVVAFLSSKGAIKGRYERG